MTPILSVRAAPARTSVACPRAGYGALQPPRNPGSPSESLSSLASAANYVASRRRHSPDKVPVASERALATLYNPSGARHRDWREFWLKVAVRGDVELKWRCRARRRDRDSETSLNARSCCHNWRLNAERPTSLDAGLSYNPAVAGFRYRRNKLRGRDLHR